MAKSRGKGDGLSFRKRDAIEVGLFSSGPATIKEAVWADFTYKGSSKPVQVALVTYSREGEEDYEQPYGIGKGWKISPDGTELIPKNGQTGLGKTCNAMLYLIGPLEDALPKARLDPDDYLGEGFPNTLEGLDVIVSRVDQVERENQKKREDGSPRTILIVEKITAEASTNGSGKTKKKAAAVDDDEDDTPKAKARAKAKPVDDDEDDDEAPAKAKGKKGTAKANAEDDELLEEGVEAVISALETEDGPIALADLDDALDVALKGNKNRKAIIALMTDVDVLALEKGWTYNERKKTITLD